MNKDIFEPLGSPDEETAQRLAAHFSLAENDKDRLFAMSERKMRAMKIDDKTGGSPHYEELDIKHTPRWQTVFRAAAGFAAAAAVVIVVFGAVRGAEPKTADMSEDEQIIYKKETPEPQDSGAYAAGAGSSATPESAERKNSDSSSKENRSTDSSASDSSKKQTLSSQTAEKKSESSSEAEKSAQSEAPAPEQIIDSSQDESVSSYITVTGEWLPSEAADTEIEPPEEIPSASEPEYYDGEEYDYGRTGEARVLSITSEMTYRQVIDRLGEPKDCMILNGYAEYIVDNDRLLMLHYEDENEQIGVDGQELLDSCPRLSEMVNDRTNRTFDCYVIDIRGESMRVTCPQYGFDCADPHFTDEQREYLKSVDVKVGDKLRIKHEDYVLEVYPCIIHAESVDKYK